MEADKLINELAADLTAIRNRGETISGYFSAGTPKRESVEGLIRRASLGIARIKAFQESVPVPPTPVPPVPIPPAPPNIQTRPYSADSPWNTPIEQNPTIINTIAPPGVLTSDPTQYTYPVFYVDNTTPKAKVKTQGWYSFVYEDGKKLDNQRAGIADVPIPSNVEAAAGSDGQVIIINRDTGEEYGFWQFTKLPDNTYSASNGYHYNMKWSAVPPPADGGGFGFVSRGAGVPYLTGLIRPWEINNGVIDHALAFAFMAPSSQFVYPATKSDGSGSIGIPEGARFQLDLGFDIASLTNPIAKIVAKALQVYGMYVIDVSGSSKVMFEYEATAKWGGSVTRSTVSGIPLTKMRRVS